VEESEEFYRQLELRRGGRFTITQELAKSRGSFLNTSTRRRFPAGRSRRRARYLWRVLEEFGLGGTECGGSQEGDRHDLHGSPWHHCGRFSMGL